MTEVPEQRKRAIIGSADLSNDQRKVEEFVEMVETLLPQVRSGHRNNAAELQALMLPLVQCKVCISSPRQQTLRCPWR